MPDDDQPYYPHWSGGQPPSGEPQRPAPGWPAAPGHQPAPYWQPGLDAPPPPRGPGITVNLGERGYRRPEARLGPALAGAGIGLAIFGVLLWSFTYLIQGAVESFNRSSGGDVGDVGDVDSRRWLGIGLSLLVVAVGYLLAVRFRRGPLATAGVAASSVGVPLALAFMSLSLSSDSPISTDAVVLVSILVWLISYFFVPGTKGHTWYLGLSAIALWGYLLDKADPGSVPGLLASSTAGRFDGSADSSSDPATIAAISLIFGLGYYAIALALERKRRSGPAVAFVVAGLLATTVGVFAVADDFQQIGTGVLLVVLGLVIAIFAARAARRFTTWYWSGAVAFGLGLILTKLAGNDHLAVAGVLLIIGGFALVAAGYALAKALNEPDEFAPSAGPVPSAALTPHPSPYPGPYPPAY